MKEPMKYSQLLQEYISSNYDSSGQALFQLGLMNFYGKGYPKNINKGLKIIQQSAKMYPYANTFLGRLYLQGEGVMPDQERALKYFQIAADQNESGAMIYLSSLYLQNEVVPYNPGFARDLLEQAVSNNSDEAMVALGMFLLEGEFGFFDSKRAFELFLKASKLGNTNADCFLGSMYEQGETVETNLKMALKYYLKGTAKKNILAHFFLGRLYLQHANPKFRKEAIVHLKIAAEATHIEAMSILSELLLESTPDYEPKTAIRYLHELVDDSHREATLKLGIVYIEGIHIKQDVKRGLELLRASKTIEAALYLGDLYATGKVVPYNFQMASSYYLIASKLGSAQAMCKMASLILLEHLDLNPIPLLKEAQNKNYAEAFFLEGLCYLDGLYVEKDTQQAITLVEKSIKMGFLPATALYADWLFQGVLLPSDKKKAISLLKKILKKGYLPASIQLYHIYQSLECYDDKLAKKYLKVGFDARIPEATYYYALDQMEEDPLSALGLLAECIQNGYTPAINAYKKNL